MKKILIVVESGVIGADISTMVKVKGMEAKWKSNFNNFESLIKNFNPDMIITEINSGLICQLQAKLKDINKPLLFLNDSIKYQFELDLIKSKWDLIRVPIDNNEFDLKLKNLLAN